ncbi:Uncharacterized conserved protein (some members contain a von Willebrand factor type A (vWA) domain) [Chlamydia abortus]|uniref:DUF58 domain-containing protein n=1 Tax=Paenibacillus residui TaxID=629724 RepID=A0ABW3DBF4_9BACL|nr:DUF58 domain-containing protein [Aneurinibacillus sp. XH2]SHE10431.1 Uncharacterized conserved protein (some members contain a von Willebrand factor type A (vWA) domain) [Chlamydia abortus]
MNEAGAGNSEGTKNTAAGLVPQEVLLRLERSSLWAKDRIRGTMQGKRRSKQMGSSLDFADYRLYTPGDDIRQLDWNAYGRTGKPFIKLYMDEQELQVSLYVDGSASMKFGASSRGVNKYLFARQLAACIGYTALCGYDRVGIGVFSDRLYARLPMMRGKASAQRIFDFLARTESREAGDIAAALSHPSSLPVRPGMSWVFSDFLYESGVEQALSSLLAAGQEIAVVQVLSPEEVDPELFGDLRLIDVESGSGKEVAISGKIIKEYKAAVHQYTEALRKYCFERGIAYQLAITDSPLSVTITEFRRSGLLK